MSYRLCSKETKVLCSWQFSSNLRSAVEEVFVFCFKLIEQTTSKYNIYKTSYIESTFLAKIGGFVFTVSLGEELSVSYHQASSKCTRKGDGKVIKNATSVKRKNAKRHQYCKEKLQNAINIKREKMQNATKNSSKNCKRVQQLSARRNDMNT